MDLASRGGHKPVGVRDGWFECEMSPIGSCALNIWLPHLDAAWEGYCMSRREPFWRKCVTGGRD